MKLIELITRHKGEVIILEQGNTYVEFKGDVQDYIGDPVYLYLDDRIVVGTYVVERVNILTIEILKKNRRLLIMFILVFMLGHISWNVGVHGTREEAEKQIKNSETTDKINFVSGYGYDIEEWTLSDGKYIKKEDNYGS